MIRKSASNDSPLSSLVAQAAAKTPAASQYHPNCPPSPRRFPAPGAALLLLQKSTLGRPAAWQHTPRYLRERDFCLGLAPNARTYSHPPPQCLEMNSTQQTASANHT